MCGYAYKNTHIRFLKAHLTVKGHNWNKCRSQLTVKKDVERDRLENSQRALPKVCWGHKEIRNCWQFEYLGSIFQPDGDHLPDVRRGIALAKSRAGQLRHILSSEALPLDLRLRLYVAGCCSILTYGAEAWLLDERTCKILNGANAYMLAHITGNHRKYEASAITTSFNLILWIRARRLRWLGHILRLPDKNGERLLKKAIRHTHAFRQSGDMLMDIKTGLSWSDLVTQAQDRATWKRE